MNRLQRNEAVLVVVDVQEKLMPVIDRGSDVERNVIRLVRGCHLLGLPAILTEQYVKGLGKTVEPVRAAFEETYGYQPIEKVCFAATGSGEFQAELRRLRKKQVLVAGVETHVCVYQTTLDLLGGGFEVMLIADALSSRTAENKAIALERMTAEGAKLSSTEMALFELLVKADSEEFRAVAKLIK
jgi:nicotinamidase-related amidase